MRRRTFIGGLAATPLAAHAATRPVPVQDAVGAASPTWRGASVLRGGKGYASCPLGQMHYRYVGDARATPVLLLHQTPLGMAEYSEIQPALARLGRPSLAVDNPSYGMSDPAPQNADMAALADNLIALLDQLKLPKVIVAGHHTGASIAIAFAARHPGRTAALVAHGTPFYDARERAERLARPGFDATLRSDGSHLVDAFREVFVRLGPTPENLVPATWSALGQFTATPGNPVYHAVFTYDMAPDLARIRAPGLILSNAGDVLHGNDRRAAALRPDFVYAELPVAGSNSLLHHADHWAGVVHSFARSAAA